MLTSTPVGFDTAPCFYEPRTGTRFELVTPYARPDLWQAYLEGAAATYRNYGVEDALELESIENGLSTTLFVVGRSVTGEVVAGARFQGPYLDPSEAHVSLEFAGFVGEGLVHTTLANRIPDGVIEFKSAWAAVDHPHGRILSDTIARSVVHATRWLDVRYCCCSAAKYATARWESSGGRIMEDLDPVPYPSDQYETTLLWWDREQIAEHAEPRQWSLIEAEALEIERTAPPLPRRTLVPRYETPILRPEEPSLLAAA